MSKDSKKNNWLVLILVVLILIIVGLIVGIVINVVNQNSQQSGVSKCWAIEDDDYARAICLIDNIADSNDGASGETFDSVLNEAFANKEYELASNLMIEKGLSLAIGGMCGDAMKLISDTRVSEFSNDLRSLFYSYAIMAATECGDEAKEAELNAAWQSANEAVFEEGDSVINEE